MKKTSGLKFLIAFSAVVLLACSDDADYMLDTIPASQMRTLSADITVDEDDAETNDTRTTLPEGTHALAWEAGDHAYLHVFTDANDNVTPTSTDMMGKFSGITVNANAKNAYIYYSNKSNSSYKTAVLTIPAAQTQASAGTIDGIQNRLPMISAPVALPANATSVSVKLKTLGSIIRFFPYGAAYTAEKVSSVQFQTLTGNIVGDHTYDLSVTPPAAFTGNANTATTTLTSTYQLPAAQGKGISMVVAPGTYSGKYVVKTNSAIYTYLVVNKIYSRATVKEVPLNLAKGVRNTNTVLDSNVSVTTGSGKAHVSISTLLGLNLLGSTTCKILCGSDCSIPAYRNTVQTVVLPANLISLSVGKMEFDLPATLGTGTFVLLSVSSVNTLGVSLLNLNTSVMYNIS